MLSAVHARGSGETHRARGLPAQYAFADVAGADGRRDREPDRGPAEVRRRNRHGARAEALADFAPSGVAELRPPFLRSAARDVEGGALRRLRSLFAPIHAARGRRFVNDDLAEAGAEGGELLPEPRR